MSSDNFGMTTRRVGSVSVGSYLADVWRYRHLCLHLAISDLRARFRGSSLGILWAMVHPFIFALMYTFVLSSFFNQDVVLYSVYIFSGVVLWEAISGYLNVGAHSIVNASGYLKQAPIPLAIFPMRTAITIFVVSNLGMASLLIYILVLSAFRDFPSIFSLNLLWAELAVFALFIFGAAWSVITALVNAKFRDTQQFLLVGTQALWFASPVLFDRKLFDSPNLEIWAKINPVLAFCDAFRNPILYGRAPEAESWISIGIWVVASWILAAVVTKTTGRKIVFMI